MKINNDCLEFLKTQKTLAVSFSLGKDSIIMTKYLKDSFPHLELRPFYLFLIDDLNFIEEQIAYAESFFNFKIKKRNVHFRGFKLNSLLSQKPSFPQQRDSFLVSFGRCSQDEQYQSF